MTPEAIALIVSLFEAVVDLLSRALGPDAARVRLEERAAILAARAAADAAAAAKFAKKP